MKQKKMKKALSILALAGIVAAGCWYGISYGTRISPGYVQADAAGTEDAAFVEPSGEENRIILSQEGIRIEGTGLAVSGSRVTISQGGSYRISGTLEEGQIRVRAGTNDTVTLLLTGMDITNSSEPALYSEGTGQTVIHLEDGTENRIQSGGTTEVTVQGPEADTTASMGAVYTQENLLFEGEGTLEVLGYINNGIHADGRLDIDGGTIRVEAVNHGIKGKEAVEVRGGVTQILAAGDGIQSDDTAGEGYGTITIGQGTLSIESGQDAIQAETVLEITGGSFQLDALDDGIHSKGNVEISGGNISLASGDDGIHGDAEVRISGGDIEITSSYEGVEGNHIYVEEGTVYLRASDDGLNANGGASGWGTAISGEEMPVLHVSGGTITVDAGGDGIDSNGNIQIDGGTTVINGSTGSWNGAIDYGREGGGRCMINGGTFLALGSSGMAETFDEESGQCSFLYNLDEAYPAGTEIVITDENGEELFRYQSIKEGSSVVFSSPSLQQGETVRLKAGSFESSIHLNSGAVRAGRSRSWGW